MWFYDQWKRAPEPGFAQINTDLRLQWVPEQGMEDAALSASETEYALGRSPQEYARLGRQAEIFRPMTRRLFEDAGIQAGMRVLDLGSGAGDVCMLLAEMVGPNGMAIGLDLDPEVVAHARERVAKSGLRNIEFVASDFASYKPSAPVDAVVGRLVLMYQKDPAAALGSVVRHLRPGGVVAFIEPLFMPPQGPDSTIKLAATIIVETLRRSGAHLDLALRLHKVFQAAGLPIPKMRFEAVIDGASNSPLYQYFADTVGSLLPKAIEYGITTAEEMQIATLAERLRAEFSALGYAIFVAGSTSAWCRKELP
jgi:ubiquinone/menaquinone biosynthesis C-methylase UbiE